MKFHTDIWHFSLLDSRGWALFSVIFSPHSNWGHFLRFTDGGVFLTLIVVFTKFRRWQQVHFFEFWILTFKYLEILLPRSWLLHIDPGQSFIIITAQALLWWRIWPLRHAHGGRRALTLYRQNRCHYYDDTAISGPKRSILQDFAWSLHFHGSYDRHEVGYCPCCDSWTLDPLPKHLHYCLQSNAHP